MDDAPIINYRDARSQTRAALYQSMLRAASGILIEEGYAALTVRRIADEVGASTKVVYTLFENKEGLIHALYAQAIQRLRETLDAVETSRSPAEQIRGLAHAYRAHMLAHRSDFLFLFSVSLPGFTPSEAARQAFLDSFGLLTTAIQQAMKAGEFAQADVESAGKVLLGVINGMLSLEIGNATPTPDADRYFAFAVETVLKGLA